MYYIGLMSGTSMDAIDAALVDFSNGQLSLVDYQQFPIDEGTRQAVRAINSSSSLLEITRLDVIMADCFTNAVKQLLSSNGLSPSAITAIGSHGQTILHLPNAPYPRTLQIGDPARIAIHTGITTIADFRRGDIAAGGQGAPLAPAFHVDQFSPVKNDLVVLNLGGMANVTVIPDNPEQSALGFDTGPGNALMDGWCQKHLHEDFDGDGSWASAGSCNMELLGVLLDTDYFDRFPPKSTGKDEFNLHWLGQKLAQIESQPAAQDIQATLLELTATTITAGIKQHAPGCAEILLCGGGIHNVALIKRLHELMPAMQIESTASRGIDPDAMEAIAFAWLAKQRLELLPGNLPAVTGASRPVLLGAVYPP